MIVRETLKHKKRKKGSHTGRVLATTTTRTATATAMTEPGLMVSETLEGEKRNTMSQRAKVRKKKYDESKSQGTYY